MNSSTTELGKQLRKLRIDRDENLGDMAAKLEMTSSYLSAIEKGKRPASEAFVDRVAKSYGLSAIARKSLAKAADKTLKSVKISLEDATESKHEAALCFARTFNDLDDETAKDLIELLKGKRGAQR